MSSILEKLAGAKALIEAAIEQELDRIGAPAPSAPAPEGCEHKNSEDITGAGQEGRYRACMDCGHEWEVK
jgi:hypothetical protein